MLFKYSIPACVIFLPLGLFSINLYNKSIGSNSLTIVYLSSLTILLIASNDPYESLNT